MSISQFDFLNFAKSSPLRRYQRRGTSNHSPLSTAPVASYLVLPPPPPPRCPSQHVSVSSSLCLPVSLSYPFGSVCLFVSRCPCEATRRFNNLIFWRDCLSVMKNTLKDIFFFVSVGLKIARAILLPLWGVKHFQDDAVGRFLRTGVGSVSRHQ